MILADRMGMDLHHILAELFRDRRSVTPLELRRALGVSRQAAWKRVRRLIEVEALVPEGAGRGRRYLPGNGVLEAPAFSGIYRRFQGLWSELSQSAPNVSYVAVH